MGQSTENVEKEVKFLEIDIAAVKTRLTELGATDRGEQLLTEVIFYPGPNDPTEEGQKWVRVRTASGKTKLSYKSIVGKSGIEIDEIEFEADNPLKAEQFIAALGWVLARRQEKRRPSYTLGEAVIDIDTWPGDVPTYLEIEGPDEETIQKTAAQLGFNWKDAVMETVGMLLRDRYNINVWEIKTFTFDKIEKRP